MSDPQLASHNAMRAAEAKGGEFKFNAEVIEIRKEGNRVKGVTLKGGEEIDAPVVVNVAGPHSFVINRMAGVEEGMNIKTKALRHEVHHVPSPAGFNYESDGKHTSDGDAAIYFRPETGNTILVGSEDPDCDPQVWVDDPDNYNNEITEAQWKAQVYRLASVSRIYKFRINRVALSICMMYRTTGFRFTINPIWMASIWQLARAGISSRMLRLPDMSWRN